MQRWPLRACDMSLPCKESNCTERQACRRWEAVGADSHLRMGNGRTSVGLVDAKKAFTVVSSTRTYSSGASPKSRSAAAASVIPRSPVEASTMCVFNCRLPRRDCWPPPGKPRLAAKNSRRAANVAAQLRSAHPPLQYRAKELGDRAQGSQ